MLEKKAAQIRLETLTALYDAERGNVGSLMSVVEILVSLYYREMKIDPAKPGWDDQDYLILSKGDSVLAQYAILADLGFFDKSELSFFGKKGALLKTRPDLKVPGMFASLPDDGQGLSIALGLALSLKNARKKNRVFTILGDYEFRKGQVWEAALCAAHYNLDNLIMIVDDPILDIDSGIEFRINLRLLDGVLSRFLMVMILRKLIVLLRERRKFQESQFAFGVIP